MAQIRQVVSESLQATIRRLLPSQRGFTEDLQASNVITPIIDLTPTAEGSILPGNLQTALAYGNQTSVTAANSTATLANTAGFWRVTGGCSIFLNNASVATVDFDMTDGATPKELLSFSSVTAATGNNDHQNFIVDFVIFLRSGDSASVTATNFAEFAGSVRQLADVNGNLVNPSGFDAS